MDDPASMETPPVTDNANIWLRLAARIVDAIVLLIPTLILVAPFGGGYFIGSENNTGKRFIAGVLGNLLAYGYYVFLEGTRGATVGKRVCGLRVEAAQGTLTTESAAKRNLWMLASIIPALIGGLVSLGLAIGIAVTANSDRLGQGFHDRWAGLRVAKTS